VRGERGGRIDAPFLDVESSFKLLCLLACGGDSSASYFIAGVPPVPHFKQNQLQQQQQQQQQGWHQPLLQLSPSLVVLLSGSCAVTPHLWTQSIENDKVCNENDENEDIIERYIDEDSGDDGDRRCANNATITSSLTGRTRISVDDSDSTTTTSTRASLVAAFLKPSTVRFSSCLEGPGASAVNILETTTHGRSSTIMTPTTSSVTTTSPSTNTSTAAAALSLEEDDEVVMIPGPAERFWQSNLFPSPRHWLELEVCSFNHD
jgi:hypothetical protein